MQPQQEVRLFHGAILLLCLSQWSRAGPPALTALCCHDDIISTGLCWHDDIIQSQQQHELDWPRTSDPFSSAVAHRGTE